MPIDKSFFMKNVVILCDTREQKNAHILSMFNNMGVAHSNKKMDFGDYSFKIQDHDFSNICVIERKANCEELYSNVVHDRERIEKEFAAAHNIANQFVLLIENVGSETALRDYVLPDYKMQERTIQNIGQHCYSTLKSWECANRYNFRTVYVANRDNTASAILTTFYYWWRNYKKEIASRRNR